MTDLAAARAAHANAVRALSAIVRETPVPGLSYLTLALEHLGWLLNQAEEHAAELAAVLADRDETGQRNVTLASDLGKARAELASVAEERDRLAFTINEIALLRRWVNEDGKGFVFSDDLLAALRPEAVPGA